MKGDKRHGKHQKINRSVSFLYEISGDAFSDGVHLYHM